MTEVKKKLIIGDNHKTLTVSGKKHTHTQTHNYFLSSEDEWKKKSEKYSRYNGKILSVGGSTPFFSFSYHAVFFVLSLSSTTSTTFGNTIIIMNEDYDE